MAREPLIDQFGRDVPDETLEKIANTIGVPDAKRVLFYMAVRFNVGTLREHHRRKLLALAARVAPVASAADKLIDALGDLDENQRAWVDEVIDRSLNGELMIAPGMWPRERRASPEKGTPMPPEKTSDKPGADTVRPPRLDDLVAMLMGLSVAMSGPRKSQKGRKGHSGAPKGSTPQRAPFHQFIKLFLRDVRQAHGRVIFKKLTRILDWLRPFVPQAIPDDLPETTLKRLMRGAKNP